MADNGMSDVEKSLQELHNPSLKRHFTSSVLEDEIRTSKYVEDIAIDRRLRASMPLTQEKFVVTENPARVQWERYVREFLYMLGGQQGHRITAEMIYEWITGISIRELAKLEGADQSDGRGGGKAGSANSHLRHINYILRDYFGKSYKTRIAGREVGKAYTVPPGFRVKRKQPCCLTLWPEWNAGTLEI